MPRPGPRSPRERVSIAPAPPKYGPTETAVRGDLERMVLDPGQPTQALSQVAIHLAAALDAGAGLSTAAVARELRATLAALAKPKETDDGDALGSFLESLLSPMDHTAD